VEDRDDHVALGVDAPLTIEVLLTNVVLDDQPLEHRRVPRHLVVEIVAEP
jgi:hypothetical protein